LVFGPALGETPVKILQIERLLASSALGLALVFLSGPGQAQQQPAPLPQIVVPLPDEISAPTAKDFGVTVTAPDAVKAEATKPETTQSVVVDQPATAKPSAEPDKAVSATAPAVAACRRPRAARRFHGPCRPDRGRRR